MNNNSINTFYDAKNLLNGKKITTLHPNVVLVDSGDVVELTHYNQVVAKWDKSKGSTGFYLVAPEYVPDGKLSRTTVKIINMFCPSLMRVSSSKSGTHLFLNGEKVQTLKL